MCFIPIHIHSSILLSTSKGQADSSSPNPNTTTSTSTTPSLTTHIPRTTSIQESSLSHPHISLPQAASSAFGYPSRREESGKPTSTTSLRMSTCRTWESSRGWRTFRGKCRGEWIRVIFLDRRGSTCGSGDVFVEGLAEVDEFDEEVVVNEDVLHA